MNIEELNEREEEVVAEKTPSEFLTQLYGNTHLVTEGSKQYYSEILPKTMAEWSKIHNFTEDDYIAIPVGSARTLPDSKSDVDLVVILNTENEDPQKLNDFSELDELYSVENKMELSAHTLKAYKSSELSPLMKSSPLQNEKGKFFHIGMQLVSALYLTPDELIFGNKRLAQKMRLEAINNVENGLVSEAIWKSSIDDYFKKYFIDWSKQEHEYKGEERSRGGRFKALIDSIKINLNAKQENLGEKWENRLHKLLKGMQVPSFSSFREGLRASEGRLSVRNGRIGLR